MKTSKLTIILALLFVLFASAEIIKDKENTNHTTAAIGKDNEEKLTLENWMITDSYWKSIKNSGLVRDYDILLDLEPWMTNVAGWELAALAPLENEKPLKVEAWMTKVKYWDKAEVKFADVQKCD
jgi:hypothetical protein